MRQATPRSGSSARSDATGDLWRGILAGLVPLVLLIVVVTLTVVCATVARVVATPMGFLTWQWIVAGVWAGGLVIAAVVYSVATVRALRRAAAWQDFGLTRQTTGVYWTLGVAALITLLPVLIAIALPQHPA